MTSASGECLVQGAAYDASAISLRTMRPMRCDAAGREAAETIRRLFYAKIGPPRHPLPRTAEWKALHSLLLLREPKRFLPAIPFG